MPGALFQPAHGVSERGAYFGLHALIRQIAGQRAAGKGNTFGKFACVVGYADGMCALARW